MNDPPTTNAKSEAHARPRRLWPWIVGLIVLGLCAVGIPAWRKVHQVQQLCEFADHSPGGHFEIAYNHPPWADHIVSRSTFLPWSDGIRSYSVPKTPITQDLFDALLQQRSLRSVRVDISDCSPESISDLGRLTRLEIVQLIGNDEPIPLEWTKQLFRLETLRFHNIPISPDDWPMLMSLPHITWMTWADTHTNLGDLATAPYLVIGKDHLTRADAEALVATRGLTVDLTYGSADPKFWEVFGHMADLRDLKLALSAGGRFELSQTELEAIENISSLKILRLVDHVGLQEQANVSPAWRNFLDHRPDVTIQQLSK